MFVNIVSYIQAFVTLLSFVLPADNSSFYCGPPYSLHLPPHNQDNPLFHSFPFLVLVFPLPLFSFIFNSGQTENQLIGQFTIDQIRLDQIQVCWEQDKLINILQGVQDQGWEFLHYSIVINYQMCLRLPVGASDFLCGTVCFVC